MQRTSYKLALLLALGSSPAAWAQTQAPLSAPAPASRPAPARRPAYKPAYKPAPGYTPAAAYKPAAAGPAATAQVAAAPAEPAAAIWAATTDYVLKTDSTLKWIAPELSRTLRRTTIKAFEASLNQAVYIESRRLHRPASKTSTLYFQTTFYNLLKNSALSPPALAAAIEGQLLKNKPKRQQEPAFQEFEARLRRLMATPGAVAGPAALAAAPAATTTPAAPTKPTATVAHDTAATLTTAATDNPAAAAALAPWWTWAALALAALSTLLAAVLWSKLSGIEHELARLRDRLLTNPSPNRRTEKESSPADMLPTIRDEVSRQLQQQLAAAPVAAAAARTAAVPTPFAAALPAAAPVPATAAAAPQPGQRVQYVNEAPFNKSFRARGLSEQPGSNSIFAIDSSEQPDQGTFTVTGNLAGHVRDHRSVLESVCEYQNGYPTGRETRIINKVPGQVRRRGDDWEVVQPAVIRFE